MAVTVHALGLHVQFNHGEVLGDAVLAIVHASGACATLFSLRNEHMIEHHHITDSPDSDGINSMCYGEAVCNCCLMVFG